MNRIDSSFRELKRQKRFYTDINPKTVNDSEQMFKAMAPINNILLATR